MNLLSMEVMEEDIMGRDIMEGDIMEEDIMAESVQSFIMEFLGRLFRGKTPIPSPTSSP